MESVHEQRIQQVGGKVPHCSDGMQTFGQKAVASGPLRELLFAFCGIYLASLIALFCIGLRPVVPWSLALVMRQPPLSCIRFGLRKQDRLLDEGFEVFGNEPHHPNSHQLSTTLLLSW